MLLFPTAHRFSTLVYKYTFLFSIFNRLFNCSTGGLGAAAPSGGVMHSDQCGNLPKKPFERWTSLSPAEKQEEFRQLIDSPYWHLLPEDIRTRIRSLVSH